MTANILEKLFRKENLTQQEARALMDSIMQGALAEAQIAAILTALRMKGETVDEIAGFAAAMRENAVRISPKRDGLVDTCGTGGDARHTFNISTATAIVVAAMGIPVAKHGNRAVSSKCGSADVLEALGVNIELSPEAVTELIDKIGIGFLFAPKLHPAMKHAAPVRQKLGVRTVFNVLGPLTNPAGVKRQLIGVFRPDLTEVMARVLAALGSERAFVVHGMDGTDEVSITGETVVSSLKNGEVDTFLFAPEDAGLKRADLSAIAGGDAKENAAHITGLLNGTAGPRRDAVLLNAGFVATLAGRTIDPIEGVSLARETLKSGKAAQLLEKLCETSRSLA
ncbi:MAG: anthranilate phosphoribosyltransferase [Planctomycetota bacterium]|jgi:anthranilate phosphoribosyltransferase